MIVRAPATSANLGPAFDCAAVALSLWNELEVTDGEGVDVDGEGAGELAADETNLAVRAYALLADPAGKRFAFRNQIPLERGLGSSAAAIALGLAAARPDGEPEELLAAGLELESHADNLAAALTGGVTLTWEGRIARIADALPLAPVALVPRERTSTEASRRARRPPSRTPTPRRTPRAPRCSPPASRPGTPSCSPPGSTTGCTSRTGRRRRWTRSAPTSLPGRAGRPSRAPARP